MKTPTHHPIIRLLQQTRCQVLGVNTGTSMDGLDLALIEITVAQRSRSVRILKTCSYPIPQPLRRTLAHLADSEHVAKEDISRTHFALGDWIGGRVIEFARRRNAGRLPGLIASHGQTIGHFPSLGRESGIRHRATWQIGSAPVIAHRTGVVTIGDFRSADIAAGGMGAPLSGFYHYLLFGDSHVVLNLGGIANISAARMKRGRLDILAFDIGPANMMIDSLARQLLDKPYDANGRMAATGTPNQRIINRVLAAPYFRRKPPKTCGREEFGPQMVEQWFTRGRKPAVASELLATAVEVTSIAIGQSVIRWIEPFVLARSLILVGGGTKNRFLVQRISQNLPGWDVSISDDHGVPAQYVEPAGFALLACETLHGRPGNLGGGTGARPAILGSISLP